MKSKNIQFNSALKEAAKNTIELNAHEDGYNGWANYETWNVALWIGNDEALYSMARDYRRAQNPYKTFIESLKEFGSEIGYQTPDGVAWNDSGLDIDALNEMIKEL